MTIIYQYRVATTSLGGFVKLLGIWKGSVYKLMYKEMMIFSFLYSIISLVYRLALPEAHRRIFEQIVIHCNSYTTLIPISFVLGFYISFVVTRWWNQFMNIPWPDRTLFILSTYLTGHDDRGRMMRRTVARYLMFSLIIICRSISVSVMKRFPTMDHIVEAGFITKDEAHTYETTKCQYNKFWVPLMWANSIVTDARRDGRIETDFGLRMIIEQLAKFRDKCSLCFVYDWITIPLVYTQVVTLAVYSFFAACIVGRQFLDPSKGYEGYKYDMYIPIFTLLQFFFYMGWLKVAEQLINPFGEDDDDFDINWLIDRHTDVGMALVDQCHGKHPPLVRDMYWYDEDISQLPYTEASLSSKKPNFLGSTFNIAPNLDEQRMLIPEEYHDYPGVCRRSSATSTLAGSLMSLFQRRPSYMRQRHESGETLKSMPISKDDRHYLTVPNGHMCEVPSIVVTDEHNVPKPSDPNDNEELRKDPIWSSDPDLSRRGSDAFQERRPRASTDWEVREPKVKPKRKLSFPLLLFNKNNNKRHSLLSPVPLKYSRFTVDTVLESDGDPKQHRPNPMLDKVYSGLDKRKISVSRPPLLSAIEEQNTVTSISQIIPPSSNQNKTENVSNETLNESLEYDVFTEEVWEKQV